MLTIELASLNEELIAEEIRVRTPKGWQFKAAQNEQSRLWEGSFRDDKDALQWEIADITLKQVLLHAVGWLEIRNVKIPEGSRWRRRSEDKQERAHERAYSVTSNEGLPDLEPDEVSSVYSSPRRGGK